MEGQETYKYRFLKTMLDGEIKIFKAKNVKQWLKMVNPGKQIYDAQVHANILKPLLKDKFILKTDKGYEVAFDAALRIESLRSKRTGPKKIETPKTPTQMDIYLKEAKLDEKDAETPEKEPDEWEKHISKRIKESLEGGE